MKKPLYLILIAVLVLASFAVYTHRKGHKDMGVDASITGVPDSDQFEIIKIIKTSLNKPAGAEEAFVDIPHGLTYKPFVEAYANGSNLPFIGIQNLGFSDAGNGKIELLITATTTFQNVRASILTPEFGLYNGESLTYNFTIVLKRLKGQ